MVKVVVFVLLFSTFFFQATLALAVITGVNIPDGGTVSRLATSGNKFNWVKYQLRWDASDQRSWVKGWVQAANDAGLNVLISVTKKPGDVPSGEAGYEAFKQYMAALASDLKGMVGAYEIWNEPNLDYEWDGWGDLSATEYVKVLASGAAGVKEGDPQAKVISAAPSPLAPYKGGDDIKYFEEFVAAGGLNYVDGIGWHSNVVSNIPPEDPNMAGFQRVKTALGKGKPVWITEFGWARDRAGIKPDIQAKYIGDAFGVASSLGDIEAMFVWNFGYGGINSEFKEWDIEGTSLNVPGTGGKNASAGSKEEIAVYNLNQGLVPKEAIPTKEPVKDFFGNLIKWFTASLNPFKGEVKNKERMYNESEARYQTSVPEDLLITEVKNATPPANTSTTIKGLSFPNPLDALKGFLGSSSNPGFYKLSLPELQEPTGTTQKASQPKEVEKYEGLYEQTNFPEGIHPILP